MHLQVLLLRYGKSIVATVMVLFVAFVLTACRRYETTNAFRSFAVDGWDSDDTLIVPIDTLQADGTFVLSLHLRVATAPPRYPYTDIVLLLSRRLSSDGHTLISTDTISLPLTSARGDMEGRGTSLLQIDVPIDTLSLPAGTSGSFALTHLMRRDPLQGIHDVGLSLDNKFSATAQW